ncbi:MAG: SpoIID/LytB domain-containing protein [bacterium]|nr:SpoIID/LytB domain-containing protein [bacterium]
MRRQLLWCALALFVNSCAATGGGVGGSSGDAPDVRVLLAEGGETYALSVNGGFSVITESGLTLLRSTRSDRISIFGEYPSISVVLESDNRVAVAEKAVTIEPHARAPMKYGKREYAGDIRVVFDTERNLLLLNVLPIELYLEGVVPYEIGDPGVEGYDAIKSQAVAARTYAYDKVRTRKDLEFDVYASVQDQVYRGLKGKTRAATSAVRDTRGRILDYASGPVRAYYSACCGGHTSDIREVWPHREAADYLHGVRDIDRKRQNAFCIDYKRFRWRYSYTGLELGDILRVTIPRELGVSHEAVGAVRDVRVVERSRSGRVTELLIDTTREDFTIIGDRIRWILLSDPARDRILPSVMFRLDKMMDGDRVAFVSVVGGGNGHGVGMCQNGAIGMAKQGYTYEMILSHYYPGCTVQKVY